MLTPENIHLNETQKEIIALFKFYEEKGFKDKQQMMSLVTVLLPIVFGLLAFCVKTILTGLGRTYETNSWLAGLAAVVAAALSGYMWYITAEFHKHAERNYKKANRVLKLTALPRAIVRLLKIPAPRGVHVSSVFAVLHWAMIILWGLAIGVMLLIGILGRKIFFEFL